MVDTETSGEVPGLYSMVAFGAVIVEPYGELIGQAPYERSDLPAELPEEVGYLGYLRPLPEASYNPEALAVSGFTHDQTLHFPHPKDTMRDFREWILENAKEPYIFIADNNGLDFAFINYYFHRFIGGNPFGWSSKNLNNLFQGLVNNTRASFKHLRVTPHDHNPLNDARGNAEALLYMRDVLDLKVTL